jgi:hypothetical protein
MVREGMDAPKYDIITVMYHSSRGFRRSLLNIAYDGIFAFWMGSAVRFPAALAQSFLAASCVQERLRGMRVTGQTGLEPTLYC